MRKLRVTTIACLITILGLGWAYSTDYRLAYEFNQKRGAYESLANLMMDNNLMELSIDYQDGILYSTNSGKLNIPLKNNVHIQEFMTQINTSFIHTKHWTMPFNSLFFRLSGGDRNIAYKKDGWGDIKKDKPRTVELLNTALITIGL